jgi:hypothetical protein
MSKVPSDRSWSCMSLFPYEEHPTDRGPSITPPSGHQVEVLENYHIYLILQSAP